MTIETIALIALISWLTYDVIAPHIENPQAYKMIVVTLAVIEVIYLIRTLMI